MGQPDPYLGLKILPSKLSKLDPLRREWIFDAGDFPPQRLEKFLQENSDLSQSSKS
jgi:hypothetical protein